MSNPIFPVGPLDTDGVQSSDITDSGVTGRAVLQAADEDAAARSVGFDDVFVRTHHCSPGTGSGGYNQLFVSLSADGKRFTTIGTRVPSTHPLYVRDPSVIRYGDTWVVAHTVAFDGTKTFGMATSTDLHNWTSLGSITVPAISGTPNNTWAPEWVIYNGEYYLVLRVSTQSGNYYGTPGPGYIKCTNPGTWTNWTDFTAISGIGTDWNDCFILERSGTWRIVAVDLDAGAGGGSKMVTATSSSPFSGYGTATQIDAAWKTQIGAGSYFEGPNIVHLGGDNYRLYVQHGNTDKTYFVDSADGMSTWGSTLTEIGFDGPEGYFSGHGTALRVAKNDFLQALLKTAQVAKEQTRIAYLGRTVLTPAGKPSFDIATGVTIPQVTLDSLTSSSTTATATKTAHGFTTGQRIMVSGAAQTEYNGEYAITVTGPNTFTYTFAGSGTTPATGTIVAANQWIKLNTPVECLYAKNGRVDLNVSAAGSDDMVSLDLALGTGAGTVRLRNRHGWGWVTRARVSYVSNTAQVDIRVTDRTRTYSIAGQYVPYSGDSVTLDIANAATPLTNVISSVSCYLPGRWEGTIDPGSIAAGAYGTVATPNDVIPRSLLSTEPYWNPAVAVSFYTTPTAGLIFADAYVGTSGQIIFRFYNATGSPIDNGAMRVSAMVNF